ncbi:WecB/TagA/CpsF family glycosyltransferase [Fulvimarina endophytica]|uniref:WecB/TagA/CpsF family glycosyltransferase n=1 Tax=Fulvimarina endophytica TaxID=2293836 RepID=A0A371X584_9HYPH|nr:WecB/TagA/CpsF family glycosyltransferase [Fulvimarina endophytica]RFC64393.1 WecB/TagA/CpsF family glycosyltransferase [Fulvimarina endophytica]
MRADLEDVGSSPSPSIGAGPAPGPARLTIAGIAVENAMAERIVDRLERAIATGSMPGALPGPLLRVAFLNAHCVNVSRKDEAYRAALGECTVLADGIGVDLAARMLHGAPFVANLNGTDFVPLFLKTVGRPLRVALVGGAPGIAERAAAALAAAQPRHAFAAVSDGFFGEAGRERVLADLQTGGFDVVLVAMGVPAQELFLTRHLDARHGRVAMGVGALFDFLAGEVSRAPPVIRRLRLEWVWRLMQEPGRLWRRYVLGNPSFVAGILADRFRMREE